MRTPDAFQLDLVRCREGEAGIVLGQLLHHRRDEDLAATCVLSHSSGERHALAEEVATFADSASGMDPDSHAERLRAAWHLGEGAL